MCSGFVFCFSYSCKDYIKVKVLRLQGQHNLINSGGSGNTSECVKLFSVAVDMSEIFCKVSKFDYGKNDNHDYFH